jgi:hypothetical protein
MQNFFVTTFNIADAMTFDGTFSFASSLFPKSLVSLNFENTSPENSLPLVVEVAWNKFKIRSYQRRP